MKVIVDESACTGHARCWTVAPAFYTQDDDGYTDVHEKAVQPGEEQMARDGEAACPERAIRIVES